MHRSALVLICLLGALAAACAARAEPSPPRKKLIEYGWDVPTPAYLRAHIREMEKRPFDGIILYLPHEGGAFRSVLRPDKWDGAEFAAVVEDLRRIEWRKFTDNFVIMWAESDQDWFDDAQWEIILHNVGLMARAAAAGRCKGLCFDAEPYGANPWSYLEAAHRDAKTFADYQAQARKRGAQFVRAIGDEMPDAVIHTFFLLSLFSNLAAEPDPAQREAMLSRHGYALLPAFLNGMLDAAGPGIVITDGNEGAYYYTDPLAYYKAYHWIRQGALALVAPENVRTYQTQVQVSQALYVDQVFNLRQGGVWLSAALTPQERARWFEQNVYYALTTADEYVWCYSERMNWWKDQNIPPGLTEAITSAREKVARREPLGFDMGNMLDEAKERLRAQMEAEIVRRTARVARRPEATPPPVIDGRLDDALWRATEPLEPFLPYVTRASHAVEAATRVRVAYDDQNLYVAFQCDEPAPQRMRVLGERRDDDRIWMGDTAEVFLSLGAEPMPHLHFILNPANLQWDARVGDEQDHLGYNPAWRSATRIGGAGWSAEIALPWTEIGVAPPRPGERRRANFCRARMSGREHTCWSQTFELFTEPDHLGTLVFER